METGKNVGLFEANCAYWRDFTADYPSRDDQHQHAGRENANIQQNYFPEMELNRYIIHVVSVRIEFDEVKMLLQQSQTETDEVANQKSLQQGATCHHQKGLHHMFRFHSQGFKNTN